MPYVNPDILSWARESAGFSIEQAASKLGINAAFDLQPEERLAQLEAGENEPTRALLVKMSKQYRRPLLTFYMAEAPRRGDRGEDFRTLPDTVSWSQNALVDVLVRQTRARQSMIKAALIEEEEDEPLQFIGSITIRDRISTISQKISDVFDINSAEYRGKNRIEDAFNYLRDKFESKGVFVILSGNLGSHHTNLDTEIFRGFALADPIAPFVVINNLDSKQAWGFTLLHEIVHLMMGETGVSGSRGEGDIEKFCNDVASEFLFPSAEARRHFGSAQLNDMPLEDAQSTVKSYANSKNLSSSMVAYKLRRIGLLQEDKWLEMSAAFRSFWLAARERNRAVRRDDAASGPSYYVVKRHKLGALLVNLVDRMMKNGALTTTRAGRILDVGPKNVANLLIRARPENRAGE